MKPVLLLAAFAFSTQVIAGLYPSMKGVIEVK